MKKNSILGFRLQKRLFSLTLELMKQWPGGILGYCGAMCYDQLALYDAKNGKSSPRIATVLELLHGMGYTLQIVPINSPPIVGSGEPERNHNDQPFKRLCNARRLRKGETGTS